MYCSFCFIHTSIMINRQGIEKADPFLALPSPYETCSVSPSVRPSVCDKSFHTSHNNNTWHGSANLRSPLATITKKAYIYSLMINSLMMIVIVLYILSLHLSLRLHGYLFSFLLYCFITWSFYYLIFSFFPVCLLYLRVLLLDCLLTQKFHKVNAL